MVWFRKLSGIVLLAGLTAGAPLCRPVSAAAESSTLQVQQLLGDGVSGRVHAAWRHDTGDRRLLRVRVVARRQSGGADVFLKLGFGDGGEGFERDTRVYLRDGRSRTASWEVGASRANGRPLVLSVSNGEVLLESVTLEFISQPAATPARPGPSAPAQPAGPRAGSSDSWTTPGGVLRGDVGSGGALPEAPDARRVVPDSPGSGGEDIASRCREMLGVRKPVIQIDSVRLPAYGLAGKYEIRGSIVSSCVQEAGYYEDGRLRDAFPFELEDRSRRREFIIVVEPGHNGEIRVYTVDGRQEYTSVDEVIRRERILRQPFFPLFPY